MRSRYTAFTRGDDAYLSASWHASTRPAEVRAGDGTKWLGLQVREHKLLDPDHAQVEFVARWRVNGKGGRLHERSRFVREAGHWFYVDGDVR
jgi:SEC-C motif-containing protein